MQLSTWIWWRVVEGQKINYNFLNGGHWKRMDVEMDGENDEE